VPACGGDFGLRILDGAGSSAEGNPQPLEAVLELETGKLQQLSRLPEIDPLFKVVAEHPGFNRTAGVIGVSTCDETGQGPQ